jgi:hypothetical protein
MLFYLPYGMMLMVADLLSRNHKATYKKQIGWIEVLLACHLKTMNDDMQTNKKTCNSEA